MLGKMDGEVNVIITTLRKWHQKAELYPDGRMPWQ